MSSDIKITSFNYTTPFSSFTTPLPPSNFSYQNMQTSFLARQNLQFQLPPLSSRYPDLNQRLHYSPPTSSLQETNPWKFSYTPPSLPPLRLSLQGPSIQTSQYLSPAYKAQDEKFQRLAKERFEDTLRATGKISPSRPLWTAEDRCRIKTYQFAGEFFNTKLPCTMGATSVQYLFSLPMNPNQGVRQTTPKQYTQLSVSIQRRDLSLSIQPKNFSWALSFSQANSEQTPDIPPFHPTSYTYFPKGSSLAEGTLDACTPKMLACMNDQRTFYPVLPQIHYDTPHSTTTDQHPLPIASTITPNTRLSIAYQKIRACIRRVWSAVSSFFSRLPQIFTGKKSLIDAGCILTYGTSTASSS